MAKPQEKGLWSLRSPTGREFAGPSPFKCLQAEVDSRVSGEEQNANLMKAMNACSLCEDQLEGDTFTPGEDTPAWLGEICIDCARIIFEDLAKVFL